MFLYIFLFLFFSLKANYVHKNQFLLKRRFIRKGKDNGIAHSAVSAVAGIVQVTGR